MVIALFINCTFSRPRKALAFFTDFESIISTSGLGWSMSDTKLASLEYHDKEFSSRLHGQIIPLPQLKIAK